MPSDAMHHAPKMAIVCALLKVSYYELTRFRALVSFGSAEETVAMYQVENQKEATILHVLGDIGNTANARFGEVLHAVIRQAHGTVVVALDNCQYLDSTALEELIRAHQRWGKRLSVVLPDCGMVARIFAVSGLDQLLNVKSSIAHALS